MLNFIIRILKFFKHRVFSATMACLRKTFLANDKLYYRFFWGSHQPIVLLVKNIIYPKRLYYVLRFGRALLPLAPYSSVNSALKLNEQEKTQLEALHRDGIVFIDNVGTDIVEHLLKVYSRQLKKLSGDGYVDIQCLEVDQITQDFLVNESLLKLISAYWHGRQPYIRMYPDIRKTLSGKDAVPSKQDMEIGDLYLASRWHYDTPNLVQFHLLMEDLSVEDTHMEFAKRSHAQPNCHFTVDDYYFSDEYVLSHYETVKCVGKKGTLYLFDANGLHKAVPKKGTSRTTFHLMFTPGNDVIAKRDPNAQIIGVPMTGYTSLQAGALKYVARSFDSPALAAMPSDDAGLKGG